MIAAPVLLVNVKVMVEFPPTSNVGVENAFAMETLPTNRVAVAVPPVTPVPMVDVTFPVVLTNVPGVALVTCTVIVHVPPGNIDAPGDMPILVPSDAPPVNVPGVEPAVHSTLGPGTAALVNSAGK